MFAQRSPGEETVQTALTERPAHLESIIEKIGDIPMRFDIKQQPWSLAGAFAVRDDAGNAVFEIRGKFFHAGDDLVMVDSSTGQELIHIQQQVLSLMPLYEIYGCVAKKWILW